MDTFYGILTHVSMIVGFLLAVILLTYTIRQKLPPAKTLAWLLAIIFIPYVAVPLYLLLGGRKAKRQADRKSKLALQLERSEDAEPGQVERLLEAFNMPGAVSGNRLTFCDVRTEGYDQMVELIDSAETSLHMETYIWEPDAVGRDFFSRLAVRAREGIKVRLLLDALGGHHVRDKHTRELREAGGEVAYFMPMLSAVWRRRRMDLRNHRKIFIADDRRVVAGGANVACEYLGPDKNPDRWVDLSFQLEGPAVAGYSAIFRQDWQFATDSELPAADVPDALDNPARTQVVPSGPDLPDDALYSAILTAAYNAAERLWIVTPYFVPDESLVQAFSLAARRGVDVRIIVPLHSDQFLPTLARRTYLRQLQDIGAKIMLYRPRMLHAKAFLIDSDLAIVGSPNMDMRSLLLNYEAALLVYSQPEIDALATWIENLFDDCGGTLPDAGPVRRLIEDTARILSPLL